MPLKFASLHPWCYFSSTTTFKHQQDEDPLRRTVLGSTWRDTSLHSTQPVLITPSRTWRGGGNTRRPSLMRGILKTLLLFPGLYRWPCQDDYSSTGWRLEAVDGLRKYQEGCSTMGSGHTREPQGLWCFTANRFPRVAPWCSHWPWTADEGALSSSLVTARWGDVIPSAPDQDPRCQQKNDLQYFQNSTLSVFIFS